MIWRLAGYSAMFAVGSEAFANSKENWLGAWFARILRALAAESEGSVSREL
jgi:hypothetical protein